MKRASSFLLLACSGATVAAALVGCNAILGIGAATQESDDGGTGGEAAPPRGVSCDYYCATIVQNCKDTFSEFVTSNPSPTDLCMQMCPVFDQGNAIGPTNDDTLGCRIYYAEQAATDPAGNCRKAGPLGGGACGSDPCQEFCSLDVTYCASIDAGVYASTTDCLAACGGDAGYPYFTTPPDAGCLANSNPYDLVDCTNTLNCRFWHLENAYGTPQKGALHCPHTQQQSPVCN